MNDLDNCPWLAVFILAKYYAKSYWKSKVFSSLDFKSLGHIFKIQALKVMLIRICQKQCDCQVFKLCVSVLVWFIVFEKYRFSQNFGPCTFTF